MTIRELFSAFGDALVSFRDFLDDLICKLSLGEYDNCINSNVDWLDLTILQLVVLLIIIVIVIALLLNLVWAVISFPEKMRTDADYRSRFKFIMYYIVGFLTLLALPVYLPVLFPNVSYFQ